MVKSMSPEGSRWARLSGDDVLERNRYINIDPWANNRVLLQVPEGQCDYINASPIEMKSSRDGEIRRFIATQVSEMFQQQSHLKFSIECPIKCLACNAK